MFYLDFDKMIYYSFPHFFVRSDVHCTLYIVQCTPMEFVKFFLIEYILTDIKYLWIKSNSFYSPSPPSQHSHPVSFLFKGVHIFQFLTTSALPPLNISSHFYLPPLPPSKQLQRPRTFQPFLLPLLEIITRILGII